MKEEFIGWYGGDYEDAGLFKTKEDAERGINTDKPLHEILQKFDGKKIKLTIEILE